MDEGATVVVVVAEADVVEEDAAADVVDAGTSLVRPDRSAWPEPLLHAAATAATTPIMATNRALRRMSVLLCR